MGKNPGDPYVIPIVISFLFASLFLGWLSPFALLMTIGLAPIQVGLRGFQCTGYGLIGGSRLTGELAKILGGIAIALGVAWEVALIGILVCGFSCFP